uniref:DNA-directed RNA polymerase n=1 Tax=Histiona aroides TaxID=392300 RepID=M4QKP2_HISAR|nr:RNA polymerase subunit beta [Histiona aroides]AGH24038.1 RNA polymerase subunit beta [Histiona aroides]
MEKKTPINSKEYPITLGISNTFDDTVIPNLLKINKSSYNDFLQRFTPIEKRRNTGLEQLLRSFIGDPYVGYIFGTASYTTDECITNNKTYGIPLYVYVRSKKHKPYTRYYVGEMPLLTKSGSFIINGVENTIVNQLTRDSGIYVDNNESSSTRDVVKIRGLKGRSVQLEIIDNTFIGRKINNKKNERLHTHQDMTVLLDHLNLSFKDVAHALTYTVEEYEYTGDKWRVIFDWSSLKKNRYNSSSNESYNANVLPIHGSRLSTDEYRSMLNTSVVRIFTEGLPAKKKKSYMVLDIYNNYGKSIFAQESRNLYPCSLVAKLLSFIGTMYEDRVFTHEFLPLYREICNYGYCTILFVSMHEKNNYYNTCLTNVVSSKKSKIIHLYQNSGITGDHIMAQIRAKEDNVVKTYKECLLSTPARLRMNCLFGTYSKLNTLSAVDIAYTIRYLIQIHNRLTVSDNLAEQDFYNKKFSSIGEQFYTCLKESFIDARSRIDIRLYRRHYSSMDSVGNDIESCKNALKFVIKYLTRSSLCQYTEQVNPLSYITHSRKVSLMGPGGLKTDNVSLEMRDVHISSYGRICPIETPEGKSVGVVTSLSVFTRVNNNNQLETPYLKVSDGIVTNTIHYLSPVEEKTKYISLANQALHKDKTFLNRREVYCRYNNQTVIVPSSKVDYIELSNKQLVSLSSSMIPFLEHNDANRALMGSNMQRQAVPLDNIEKPLVGTGMESIAPRDLYSLTQLTHSQYMPFDTSLALDHLGVLLYKKIMHNKTFCMDIVKTHQLVINKHTNQKTMNTQRIQTVNGYNNLFNSVSYSGYAMSNNAVSLGNNILIAFTSMNGHTFEDSIVISERLLRHGYLQSTHLEVYKTMESQESDSQEVIKHIPEIPNMDIDGVISIGSVVKKDDVLVCKEKRQLYSINKNKLIVSDKSMRYKSKKNGYVVDVVKLYQYDQAPGYVVQKPRHLLDMGIKDYLARKSIYLCPYLLITEPEHVMNIHNRYICTSSCHDLLAMLPSSHTTSVYTKTIIKHLNNGKNGFDDDLYQGFLSVINMWGIINQLSRSYTYKFLKELTAKHAIKQKEPFISLQHRYNPYLQVLRLFIRGRSSPIAQSIKNPSDIMYSDTIWLMQRMLSISTIYTYKTLKLLYANIAGVRALARKEQKVKKTSSSKYEDNHLKMVKVVVATTHGIQAGDKLTGRYGNKGVISRVLSVEDMPYLRDGTPVDIILSPLGVSSRMNIGQLFENYLGNITMAISTDIQQFMHNINNNNYLELRHYISALFKNTKEQMYILGLNKRELLSLSASLVHGAGVGTQVFNSATSTDLDRISRKLRLDTRGKVELLDGVTGEPLDNKVTAGYLYVMKLNHLIDHKIHGRSTGPYNVVTQQASKGKSRNGGQRLGEMEVWALQAYGAAYTLQEMLTFKSDSTVARTNFLQQFIKGKSYRIDIPRTFKLLRDELRVLGMELFFMVQSNK